MVPRTRVVARVAFKLDPEHVAVGQDDQAVAIDALVVAPTLPERNRDRQLHELPQLHRSTL